MDISENHKKLLEAQASAVPTLTIRQMGEVIGKDSPGHVFYILDEMVKQGLAEKVKRGKKHVYRMLPAEYKHNRGHQ